jgi:diguanylate cyclase (GGDEF)-like protein
VFYLDVYKAPRYNQQGELVGTIGIGRDVTELMAIKKELDKRLYYDELTGLNNKTNLNSKINDIVKDYFTNKKIGAVLFMDLDNFKNINDDMGHDVGDSFLVSIADRLKIICKESDCEIIRFSGDEFIFLLKELSEDLKMAKKLARIRAEEIRNEISKEVYLIKPERRTVSITCSIGIYIIKDAHISHERIKSSADIAMNEAKSRGKNLIVTFTESLRKNMMCSIEIEKNILNALKNNEFELYLQPQFRLREGGGCGLIGAEALIRWNTEEGVLSPFHFIDIAEKSGQIIQIGKFVLQSGFDILQKWSLYDDFKHLILSLNVSPRQFQCASFVNDIKNMLETYSFNLDNLKLELTENVAIEDFDNILLKMKELKEMGKKLSLDDFGTGFSSLSNLTTLPFSQIKIDKSFVDKIVYCSNNKQIVKSVHDIANEMRMNLIVEGVEELEQVDELIGLGVKDFQGYYFGRPMRLVDFERIGRVRGLSI